MGGERNPQRRRNAATTVFVAEPAATISATRCALPTQSLELRLTLLVSFWRARSASTKMPTFLALQPLPTCSQGLKESPFACMADLIRASDVYVESDRKQHRPSVLGACKALLSNELGLIAKDFTTGIVDAMSRQDVNANSAAFFPGALRCGECVPSSMHWRT